MLTLFIIHPVVIRILFFPVDCHCTAPSRLSGTCLSVKNVTISDVCEEANVAYKDKGVLNKKIITLSFLSIQVMLHYSFSSGVAKGIAPKLSTIYFYPGAKKCLRRVEKQKGCRKGRLTLWYYTQRIQLLARGNVVHCLPTGSFAAPRQAVSVAFCTWPGKLAHITWARYPKHRRFGQGKSKDASNGGAASSKAEREIKEGDGETCHLDARTRSLCKRRVWTRIWIDVR